MLCIGCIHGLTKKLKWQYTIRRGTILQKRAHFCLKKKKKQITKQNKNDGVDHYCIVVNTLLQPLLYGLTLFFYYSQSITLASCEI